MPPKNAQIKTEIDFLFSMEEYATSIAHLSSDYMIREKVVRAAKVNGYLCYTGEVFSAMHDEVAAVAAGCNTDVFRFVKIVEASRKACLFHTRRNEQYHLTYYFIEALKDQLPFHWNKLKAEGRVDELKILCDAMTSHDLDYWLDKLLEIKPRRVDVKKLRPAAHDTLNGEESCTIDPAIQPIVPQPQPSTSTSQKSSDSKLITKTVDTKNLKVVPKSVTKRDMTFFQHFVPKNYNRSDAKSDCGMNILHSSIEEKREVGKTISKRSQTPNESDTENLNQSNKNNDGQKSLKRVKVENNNKPIVYVKPPLERAENDDNIESVGDGNINSKGQETIFDTDTGILVNNFKSFDEQDQELKDEQELTEEQELLKHKALMNHYMDILSNEEREAVLGITKQVAKRYE